MRGRIVSKAVIFGITGYAGGSIANELLDRGHHVVGVARNPGDVAPREHLEVLSGSVYDPALLSKVAQEAEAIVLAIRVLQDDGAELATMIPTLLEVAVALAPASAWSAARRACSSPKAAHG
jgi:putative NADH-flavin reductase